MSLCRHFQDRCSLLFRIEHSKLEFTLTIKVRRDPHIISQFKALAPAPPPPAPVPPPVVQTASKSSGMRSFFSSSPKKAKEKVVQPPPTPPTSQPPLQRLPENLARYLKPDGTLARAFISFKDIAPRCDTRLFETSYPLIGQRVELGGKFSTLQVGEISLQMFRLPPLPGIPSDQLPQSLEDCHRGLRHINWHKVTYFQGTLTQSGGDCSVKFSFSFYFAPVSDASDLDLASTTIACRWCQSGGLQRRDKEGYRDDRPQESDRG